MNVSFPAICRTFQPNFFDLAQTTPTLLYLLRKSHHVVIVNVSVDITSNIRQSIYLRQATTSSCIIRAKLLLIHTRCCWFMNCGRKASK
ncbi:hypothetical protein BDQ12DRAFT_679553 [Crucibulum laeve]|uniref:Uncharacterized protein n=1 Tax=Crucibulum laeve TaxID=68775 RepID=A0A5C3M7W3_9AGAR|nr:hypothetical protein BDQ12DRAFT_679553 [Crucibulum laeve]